eukprot:1376346-Pleurochrysis_carterae.AAC.1
MVPRCSYALPGPHIHFSRRNPERNWLYCDILAILRSSPKIYSRFDPRPYRLEPRATYNSHICRRAPPFYRSHAQFPVVALASHVYSRSARAPLPAFLSPRVHDGRLRPAAPPHRSRPAGAPAPRLRRSP